LLLLNEPTADGAELALIDCGLMASVGEEDRDHMVSAVIHLANKDYASLVDDFIQLKILPQDTNRAAVIPLMDKALSPYVKGGGAKKYEEELRKLYGMNDGFESQVGGFQAMTQDALTVLNDIPFSIPPYFAILGRAIVTLEGVGKLLTGFVQFFGLKFCNLMIILFCPLSPALTGDPNYGIILQAYPFIARKLLQSDRPEIQTALQQVLYSGDGSNSGLKLSRLLALLNNAAGSVATQDGAVFVDIDAVPEDGITFKEGLKFLLSDKAESLRTLLEPEVDSIVDILVRQIIRKGVNEAVIALTPPRPPALPFMGDIFPPSPKLDEIPLPMLLPRINGGAPSIQVMSIQQLTDLVVPKLSQDDELFALGLADAAEEFFGTEMAEFVRGESVFSTQSVEIILSGLRSGAFRRIDALSPQAVENVVESVSRIISLVRGSTSSGSRSKVEKELQDAVINLNESERERLEEIMNELTRRTIARALERLSAQA
jgi:aarF domain-containing kinase